MLISNGKSNVGVAYADNTAVEITDTTTEPTETEGTEIDYSTLFQWSVDSNNNITITKYIGTDTDVVIPSEIDGNPVTSIDSSAFYNCSSLTSVIIPESVTKISGYAFYYCTSLISVTIPENITYISERAFAYCSSLTEINLHENITSIYDDAFYYCTSLTNIKLPKNLKSIGAHAFYHSGIASINIPLSITHINRGAFEECRNLKSVYITSIEQWCGFSFVNSYTNPLMYGGELYLNNELVTNLDIPNTITQIGNYAFYGCSSLVKVTIPESVTTIGEEAFRRCTNLTTINLPKNITKISYCLFYDCSSLISVNIPENVTSIATTAFCNCTSLTSITIPDNVTSIGGSAFSGCTNLQSIKFSDNSSLTSIGGSAFYRCLSLKNIQIPKGVTNIGNEAFNICTKLMAVYVHNADLMADVTSYTSYGCLFDTSYANWGVRESIAVIGENITVGSYIATWYKNTEVITYNGNTYTVYSTHEHAWELDYKIEPDCVNDGFEQYVCTTCGLVKNNDIPALGHTESDWIIDVEATTETVGHQYKECTVCKDVLAEEEIPVKEIDYSTMFECTVDSNNNITITKYIGSDTEVMIPSEINGSFITSIGANAFENCTNLTKVIFSYDSQITKIDNYAFSGCVGLTSIIIPEKVTEIGNSAFNKCSGLTEIQFAENSQLNSIGNEAFAFSGVSSISFPENLTDIGSYSFRQCSNLKYVYIPSSVVNIGERAFQICGKLSKVEFAENSRLLKIEDFAFWMSGIANIELPENIESIGEGAFENCNNLSKIVIPDTVRIIEKSAFMSCQNLQEVIISPNSKLETIGQETFKNCYNLTDITIPKAIISIEYATFYRCTSLTAIDLPDNLTNIGQSAFYECKMSNIQIPKTLKSIGYSAFDYCSYLTEVHITDMESWQNITFANDTANPLYYAKNLYLNGELVTELVIPEGTTTIGNAYANSSITSIVIPESVTTISANAFKNCAELVTVNIPKNVTSIGDYAFYNCKNLTNINAPKAITFALLRTTVSSPDDLVNGKLPDGITSIGSYAFSGCTSLTNITIPSTVTSIGSNAFSGCTNLTLIYLENAELASDVAASSSQGKLFESRQAIVIIGENPTVGSYITSNYANVEVITYNGNTYTVYSTHEQVWAQTDYEAATCVTDGFEQCVCEDCGLVKNGAIIANGHTESDWIVDIDATTDCAGHKYIECTVCKEVLAEEEIPALGVVVDEDINYQHSCSFHNNLTLNFYIPAEDLNKYDSFYLYVEQDIYANGIWGVQSFEIHKSELTSNGYKFVFTGIGAADAGNEIRATLYAQLGDVQYKSLVDVYSVKTYAYNRLEKSTDSQFKTLLVDMLNYCSAAQVYFGVNVDNLVNTDLTEEQKALATTADSTVADTSSTVALEGATAQIKAKSIVFNSNIEVKFYMDLSSYQDLTGIALRITYTDGLGVTHVTVVESSEFVYEKSQESYTAKLVDLNSAELRAQIKVEIMLDEQVISDTLYYSVETYVYNRLSKSTDENFKALLKVLMKYSDSANKYFYKGGA